MAGRVAGKTALVTGAGSGLGRAIAEVFAREGARVVCADISGRQEEVAAAIGPAALSVHADVSVSAEVQRMIAIAEDRFGSLDILVNNAGLAGAAGPIHEQDESVFDELVAVNLRGVFLGMKYGIAAMLRSGRGGSVINIASVAALVGTAGMAPYAAAKAGVVQLTKSSALEYAQQHIRVNAICPGLVWTEMTGGADASRVPPAGTPPPPLMPAGRWGLDTEIAATALFLAGDEAAYMTGAALPVDGGFTAG